MGKGSAPPPPDYMGATQLQGEISKENLNTQNYANRPTINTAWGSQTWDTQAVKDPATGQVVTQWVQNNTLAPGLQNALQSQVDLQQGRSDLANSFMGRVASEYSQPFDYANLPAMAQANQPQNLQTGMADYTPGVKTGINFDTNYRDRVANDLFTKMQPVHERQQSQLETQLANQGYQVGTEGYTRALADLQGRQANERFNALDSAGQEASRLFGMEQSKSQFNNQALGQASALDMARMQAQNQAIGQQFGLNQQYADAQNRLRQQAIAEQAQRRGMSLNEMNALLSGQQVSMPQMPSFQSSGMAQTPNLVGALGQQYDAQLGAYNAEQAGMSNLMGGLFSLGSTAMGMPGGSLFKF